MISIKANKNNKSLNEFLNIKNIEDSYLYTLDEQVVMFLKVYPINTELFSEEELEHKTDSMSIEFSSEQFPYSIFIIPRKVDIAEFINEQQELKKNIKDDVSIEIIEKRIKYTNDLVANKNIIENEFYLCIWDKYKENIEEILMKRGIEWKQRLKKFEYHSEILNKSEIILMIKSFTIPEFARKEDTDYIDNIVRIRRKSDRIQ